MNKSNSQLTASRSAPRLTRGLRERLFWSHMTVAGIGLVMMLVVFALTLQLRSAALRSAQIRGPTAHESTLALEGVQRSLAGLRGWIALADHEFKDERRAAWKDDINPSLNRLKTLSANWTNPQNSRRLSEVVIHLQKLNKAQWWIEDVAQAMGNRPASMLLSQNVEPSANDILSSISALIDMEESLGIGNGRKFNLGAMADLRRQFTNSRVILNKIVNSELNAGQLNVDIEEFHHAAASAKHQLNAIADRPQLLTKDQFGALVSIQAELPAYVVFSDEAIAARQSPDWDVARYLLREDAVPSARQATDLLRIMCKDQNDLMRQDAHWVGIISNSAIGVSAGLIVGMLFVTLFVSRKSAMQVAEPITTLSRATQRFAAGELHEDIPVSSSDELGELTRAFNTMRIILEQHTDELEKKNTELQGAVTQLSFSERQIRTVVEAAPVGMLMVRGDGSIEMVNSALEELFGYEEGELIDQPVENLVPEKLRARHPQLREAYMQHPAARAMGENRDLSAVRKDGSEIAVEIGLNPIKTSDGLAVLASVVDITERKRHEDALERYAARLSKSKEALEQSNMDLQQFAYIASHDLQTPLRGIAGFAQFLQKDYYGKLDEKADEYINLIVASAKQMQTLINDLLSYSRIESRAATFKPIDLNGVFERAVTILAPSIQDTNGIVLHDELPTVNGDGTQLSHLFQNLIGNGLKYHGQESPRIHVSAEYSRSQWTIAVHDNGIGIDKKHHEKIFEIFRRLHTQDKYPGTGIGLAFCRRIVHRHGGKIWLESKSGEGSVFYFTIPDRSIIEI